MLQSLLSALLETLLAAAGGAIVKFLGLESIVELVTAVVGLAFIAIGFTTWWLGH